MPDPVPSRDQTYFLSPEDAAEMARLIALDRFTTRAMGGPLAEQAAASAFQQVLDVACGPGGWALDVAYHFARTEVIGVDISKTMIAYANARARSQGLENISFSTMDVTRPLAISDHTFDLVNGRFLIGFLTRAAWPKLIRECWRVLRPGGVLRLTETDWLGPTNSQAFEQLQALSAQMYARLPGPRSFSPDARTYGITPMLTSFLRETGFHEVSYQAHAIDFSAGTDAWADVYTNTEIVFQLIRTPLIQMGITTAETFDPLFQQMQGEARLDTFRGMWYFLTAWGKKGE